MIFVWAEITKIVTAMCFLMVLGSIATYFVARGILALVEIKS